MEGGEKPTLNANKIAKRWPEFRGEKRAPIGDYWVWKVVLTYYHFYYNFYKPEYINGNLDWFVVNYLHELINND